MSNPVQGWYADPAGTGQLRWWDGAQWTDRFQAAPAANAATDSVTPNAAGDAAATSETAAATAAQAVPQPANTTAQFTPVAQAPATKATGGQIALAVIASPRRALPGVEHHCDRYARQGQGGRREFSVHPR